MVTRHRSLVALVILLLLGWGRPPAQAQITVGSETWFSQIQDISVDGFIGTNFPNAGAIGTADTLLACYLNGTSQTCQTGTNRDILGPVQSGGGTTGSALIAYGGQALCQFDGATVAGHYVQLSTGTAGNCTDAGPDYPTNYERVLGMVPTTNGSAGIYGVYLFGRGIQAPRTGYPVVLSDASVTNSATLVSVSELYLYVAGTGVDVYRFECQLLVSTTSAAADYKFAWAVPTGTVLAWGAHSAAAAIDSWAVDTGTTPNALLTESSTLALGSANATTGIFFRGVIFGGATPGNVQLQFAQNTATAVTSTVKRGSTCAFTKVVS